MAFWTFSTIFAKTIVEYQYNVLVSARFSAERMVSLTGCLYAAAGVVSSLVNVVGTPLLLQRAGMLPAILATPACMLGGAALVLARPGAWRATFVGRVLDLSLRWSLNNTVRSVLWIAVPQRQAAASKPWVEGTVKKASTSITALAITAALRLGLDTPRLALLTVVVCAAGVAQCRACLLYTSPSPRD